jgi:hypothetical protein
MWGGRRVGIGASCRRAMGIGGHGHASGWESTRIGAARSAGFRGVGGRAGRHRQRRLDYHQALCGDSGQPLPRHDPWWHYESPQRASMAPRIPLRALVAPRIPIARLDGTSHPLHGAYRGRGRPESPPIPSRYLNRLWRCRPARPPTHRNPALRAGPRCPDPHPSAAPPCVSTHPSFWAVPADQAPF